MKGGQIISTQDYTDQGYSLHPSLRATIRGFRIGLYVLVLVLVVMVVLLVVMSFQAEKGGLPVFLPVLIAVAAAVPMFGLYFYLRRVVLARIYRASRVLQTGYPRPMVMKFLRISGPSGFMVELRPEGAVAGSPPWGLASVMSIGKKTLPKESIPVTVYEDNTTTDKYIVINTEKMVLWGHLTTPESRSAMWKKFRLLIYALGALLVLVLIVAGILQQLKMKDLIEELKLAESSLGWPEAPGSIVSSELKNVRIRKGKGTVSGFKAEIVYEYTVSDKTLKGDLIHFGYSPTRNRSPSFQLVQKYPAQSPVTVTHNPQNPRQAVLEPGHQAECQAAVDQVRNAFFLIMGAGLLCLLILIILVVVMNRRWKKVLGS